MNRNNPGPENDGLDVDLGRSLLLDADARRAEISRLRAAAHRDAQARRAVAPFSSKPGISIIVPTHGGESRIGALLASLEAQTLEHDRFETVIVENGTPDGTRAVVEAFAADHPDMTIRYFYREAPSAGGARNLGIPLARMSRTTFIDDDDTVQPRFLEAALALSTGTNIVLSPIINMTEDGDVDEHTTLNQRIAAVAKEPTTVPAVPWALGLNACKLVPTWMLRTMEYDEELRSGEDLVFWAQVLTRPTTPVVAVAGEDTAYVRLLRAHSISRREMDWRFAVEERLEAIAALEEIPVRSGTPSHEAIQQMQKAQTGFIRRFLEEEPSRRADVERAVDAARLSTFPWSILNKDRARDLAFSYCFSPFSDTSAVVAAKAIAERERIVDVIAQDMSKVRRIDPATSALADRWVDQRIVIPGNPSFAGWSQISSYATAAVAAADKLAAHKEPYETVYSRALWVGSHVAGALYKLRHWQVRWTAEFSDPLRVNAEGEPRIGAAGDDATWRKLLAAVQSRGFADYEPTSVFDLTETAALLLADELIFTNANQLDFMLSLLDHPALRELAEAKAVVREHPTPPAAAYDAVETAYDVPTSTVNLAYFGSFYPNRGIGEVLVAMSGLREEMRRKVRLHVFSNKKEEVRRQAAALGVAPMVYSNNYLSYMEFLNATRLFDVLVATDVNTDGGLPMNPFLPSKYSDYKGSGQKIWGIVEDGSPLSTKPLAYASRVGNSADALKTLEAIVNGIADGSTAAPTGE